MIRPKPAPTGLKFSSAGLQYHVKLIPLKKRLIQSFLPEDHNR